jgi:tetratricopeptide (TPR) repeat protein
MRARLLIGGTVAACVATVLLLGGALRESTPAAQGGTLVPTLAAGRLAGEAPSTQIGRLEDAVRARPRDAEALAHLGLAYQQRYRETADPSDLARSEDALGRALRLDPADVTATSGLASLALSRHDFHEALRLGRRAVAAAPGTARHHGVVGDALLELGRHREAFAAFDRMVELRPDVASYARVAYARELLGRPRAAIAAMELAAGAAGLRGEPAAWAHVELGKLHFGLGELRAAERSYRLALAARPGYVFALDALARVEAARGRLPAAISLARRAVASVPLPQFAGTLADLYDAAGREAEAREQVRLVGAIERLLRANGVRTDLETALFDLDRGVRLRDALAGARRAHADRPGLEADDVLGWALVRNGRCAEGLGYARRALRLDTQDALKLFHRGMAERCLGRRADARRSFAAALALNPHFSIRWAPLARRYAS